MLEEATSLEIRRSIRKYKKTLIIILVYCVLLLSLAGYAISRATPEALEISLTPLIPVSNQYIEIALIFLVICPISALLGSLIEGYLLAPTFLFIHKKIFGSKLLYGIQERPESKTFKKVLRGYFPAQFTSKISS